MSVKVHSSSLQKQMVRMNKMKACKSIDYIILCILTIWRQNERTMSMGNVEPVWHQRAGYRQGRNYVQHRLPRPKKNYKKLKDSLGILPNLYILRLDPYFFYIFVRTYKIYCFFSTEYSPTNKCPSFLWIPIPIRLSCLVSPYCSKKEYLWLKDKS